MDMSSVGDVSAIQAAITRQQIDITLLKKAMDISKAQAQAAIELIETAAEIADQHRSHGNRNLDVII